MSESTRVFMTGATGFIGRVVLERLVAAGVERISCLVRDADSLPEPLRDQGRVRAVPGRLEDETTWSHALGEADIIVHLAAATGNAAEALMRAINVDATRRLAELAAARGADHFVYMSSIAAAGDRLADYPYGRIKLESEQALRATGISCTILRPTIVLGRQAPNWPVLRKLACLPVVPLFGGGKARVQPIAVADVARAVELVVGGARTDDPIVELGGPETLSFADFLRRIRHACGARGFPGLPVPVGPFRLALGVAARLTGGALPVSPGQLTPFVTDGVAAPSALADELRPSMTPLDAVLRELADDA